MALRVEITKPLSLKEELKTLKQKINTLLSTIGLETTTWIRTNRMSGNPIRRRTGNLVNSVFFEVNENQKTVKIGSRGVIYAKYLEFAQKLANYRWLRPALEWLVNGGLDRIIKRGGRWTL